MSNVTTVTRCPPGVARGAEFSAPKSKSRNARNHYNRFLITARRDNAHPGDVLAHMGRVLFPQEVVKCRK